MTECNDRPTAPGNLQVRHRPQQGDLFGPPAIAGRVGDAQLLALLPHCPDRPTGSPCYFLIGHRAEQGDVFGRPQRPVVAGDEVSGQALSALGLPPCLTLLVRPVAGLDRLGPLLGRRLNEPGGPLVADAGDAEGLPPVPDDSRAGTPPVHDSRSRLVPDGAGQLLIDEQPRATALRVEGAAARPGNRGGRPTGDDDGGVAVQAGGAVAALQRRGLVGAEQEGR